MRKELERRLGNLQQELVEATAAKHKTLRDLCFFKVEILSF
jgi:hypothetical protein